MNDKLVGQKHLVDLDEGVNFLNSMNPFNTIVVPKAAEVKMEYNERHDYELGVARVANSPIHKKIAEHKRDGQKEVG